MNRAIETIKSMDDQRQTMWQYVMNCHQQNDWFRAAASSAARLHNSDLIRDLIEAFGFVALNEFVAEQIAAIALFCGRTKEVTEEQAQLIAAALLSFGDATIDELWGFFGSFCRGDYGEIYGNRIDGAAITSYYKSWLASLADRRRQEADKAQRMFLDDKAAGRTALNYPDWLIEHDLDGLIDTDPVTIDSRAL